MAKDSPITWTDDTFNAWWGCFKISPGCVAFHFKQWAGEPDARIGGQRVSGKIHLPILDGRVHAAFPDAPNA